MVEDWLNHINKDGNPEGTRPQQVVEQVGEGGQHPPQLLTSKHWQSSIQIGSGIEKNEKLRF